MIDIRSNYQSVIFVPTIDASPQNISDMMLLFMDKGFVPTTRQELAFSNEAVPVAPQLRFSLNSPQNEWVILFASGCINISKNQTDAKGSNIGSIEQFSKDASDLFLRILRKTGQKANRLTLSSNCILKEMPQQTLDEIFTKLFNPTTTFEKNKPFEWSYRVVSRLKKQVNNKEELLNCNMEINRFIGKLNFNQSLIPLDRISVTLGISTIPDNIQNRFSEDDINDYFNNAHIWHDALFNEFIEKLK
jgi:hypothetical protein